jgi:hypothetical protein
MGRSHAKGRYHAQSAARRPEVLTRREARTMSKLRGFCGTGPEFVLLSVRLRVQVCHPLLYTTGGDECFPCWLFRSFS